MSPDDEIRRLAMNVRIQAARLARASGDDPEAVRKLDEFTRQLWAAVEARGPVQ